MDYLIIVFLLFLGAVLGSFYAVLGSRLPRGESVIYPGSHCEYCDHHLSWYELIPVISFLMQKGKCRNCHRKLSLMYPATEVFTGILFILSYLKFGFTANFFLSLILSSLVVIIFVSDIKYMIILDSPLIISSVLIFLIKWISGGISEAFSSLLAGIVLFVGFYFIGFLGSLIFKREALGGGDIKLAFVIGMALNIKMAILAFILSTFLALPYAVAHLFLENNHELPFGPFLVSALWIIFFFYEKFKLIYDFLFII